MNKGQPKKKDKYLGYDPKVIDAWFEVYKKHAYGYGVEVNSFYHLYKSVGKKYVPVVASMINLARWIEKPGPDRYHPCALCASITHVSGCSGCPYKRLYPFRYCPPRASERARIAAEIYDNEYRKVFGDK